MAIASEPTGAEGVRWDLSALFASPDDPRIDAHWDALHQKADAFAAAYRGRLATADLDAETLASALADYERLSQESVKPAMFANLLFAVDTNDPALGAFLQKQQEKLTELSVKTMFFALELQQTPDETLERCLADQRLATYRHYVRQVRQYKPHTLSEPEEILLEETANTGSRAWNRLFDELTSNHVFRVKMPNGEEQTGNQSMVVSLLRHHDREVRQAAADALTEGLEEMSRVLTFTFNILLQDKAIDDRLRGYEAPESNRHLQNELDAETVNLVVERCRAHYRLVERFYRVKRDILGLPELTHIDRYAPLFEAEGKIGYDEARKMVLEAFGEFSPAVASAAEEFFAKNWIDAEVREGKSGGAFCAYITPDLHPVVMVNYLGKMDDVMTLAHELGHGVHASFSRQQSWLNFNGTLPLAELSSTFGEMLVFEKVTAQATLKDRLALYAEKIEGIFATVFRQAAMYQFERRAHAARRSEGEQTAEQYGEIWHEELQAMFGESVKLGDQHKRWWSYIPHFVGSPFYVYAYSIGELLVLSLYQKAKAEGPAFADRYVELLKLAGAYTPHELMATVDVNLRDPAFWDGGFQAIERLVQTFEQLWSEYRISQA